ncbi:FtsK/SpoIIIE domain-containing protein [Priestia megaterium]|uniref:FtsK/SpoIIIE domain-containing protein n=1 Tax=Priestia megaterium TaxID=1404 RepID=UPI0015D49967|nr:FtsK/SpoIIIE domain-containing protein [Priestia megaterium]
MSIRNYLAQKKTLRMARRALKRAFNAGGIYIAHKNSGGKQIRQYPRLLDMRPDTESETFTYVFSLPLGFSPDELRKREYVFRQAFGGNIELGGEDKVFTLTLFNRSNDETIDYNYGDFMRKIHGKKMPIVCGKDKRGQWFTYDMVTNPYAVIGGVPGSGKSSILRIILTTLILTKKPSELSLYLIDCKRSEFHLFRNIQHTQALESDKRGANRILDELHAEMLDRTKLLEVFGIDHIDKLPKEHRKPYILLCIDEYVMLRDDKLLNAKLIELVAMGRALGIYAILSMQRPSHKVIDTTLRDCLDVSMGFKVRNQTSAEILETPGADKLTKSGQFIIDFRGENTELKAPYLDLDVAKELLNVYWRAPKSATNVTPNPAQQVQPDLKKLTDNIFGQDDENWEDESE